MGVENIEYKEARQDLLEALARFQEAASRKLEQENVYTRVFTIERLKSEKRKALELEIALLAS